jgi:hypothetical protein
MKKIYTILFTALGLNLLSQTNIQVLNVAGNQTFAANSILHLQTLANDNVKFTLDLKNTGTSKQNYVVKRYDMTLHAVSGTTASAYFCFAGNCYGASVIQSSDTLKLIASKKASELGGSYQMLTADLDEALTVGFSHVKYTFMNANRIAFPNDTVQITVKYNDASAVSIKANEKNLSVVDLYPNPTSGSVTLKVNSEKVSTVSIQLFNSLGEAVITKETSFTQGINKINIDTENLPDGVYFMNVKTNDSSIIKSLIIR